LPHLSYSATCRPNKLILHDFINLTVLGKEKVNKLYKALHDVIFSNSQLYLSGPNIVLRRFFSKTLQLCFGHKKKKFEVSYAYKTRDKLITFAFIEQPRNSASIRIYSGTHSACYTTNIRGSSHWCTATGGMTLTAYAYQPPASRMSGVAASNAPYKFMQCTRTNLHLQTEEKEQSTLKLT
jgi:hypothetical protein